MALGLLDVDRVAFGLTNWSVIVVYLVVLLLMGLYFSRRERTTHEFFLAGRRIPWWAAGLSIFGTQLSALSFMAVPAVAYSGDWIRMTATGTIVLVAGVVVTFFLPFFRRLEISTAYEYLERRFSLAVRLFGSTMFVLFQFGRIGIVLYLPALALSAVTGLDVFACIMMMGVFCTVYTVLGGIEAVIWTDVLQVVVLMASAIWCLGVILADAGGPAEVLAVAASQDKLRMFDWRWDPTAMVAWVMLVGSTFTNLVPYTTDQSVIQRYLTTRDESAAARCGHLRGLHVVARQQHEQRGNQPGERRLPAAQAGRHRHRLPRPGQVDHGGDGGDWGRHGHAAGLAGRHSIRRRLLQRADGAAGRRARGRFPAGLFTRRTSARGALVGAVVGAAAPIVAQQTTDLQFFLYAPIGVVSCVVVGYLTSLVLPDPRRDLTNLTWSTLTSTEPRRSSP